MRWIGRLIGINILIDEGSPVPVPIAQKIAALLKAQEKDLSCLKLILHLGGSGS